MKKAIKKIEDCGCRTCRSDLAYVVPCEKEEEQMKLVQRGRA